jgi:hypothetical protein
MATLSANSKSLDCNGNWRPFLKKRIFWSRSNFVHFSSLHGTLEYLHDLQAKKGCANGELSDAFVCFGYLMFC